MVKLKTQNIGKYVLVSRMVILTRPNATGSGTQRQVSKGEIHTKRGIDDVRWRMMFDLQRSS